MRLGYGQATMHGCRVWIEQGKRASCFMELGIVLESAKLMFFMVFHDVAFTTYGHGRFELPHWTFLNVKRVRLGLVLDMVGTGRRARVRHMHRHRHGHKHTPRDGVRAL